MSLFFLFFIRTAIGGQLIEQSPFLKFTNRIQREESPENGYRFLNTIYKDISDKIKEKPGVIEAKRIGRTVQNRPIWSFHIKHPMHPPKKNLLIFGGLHALEWISVETTVVAIEKLVDDS